MDGGPRWCVCGFLRVSFPVWKTRLHLALPSRSKTLPRHPMWFCVGNDGTDQEWDVTRRDQHQTLVLEPVLLAGLDDFHFAYGASFGDDRWCRTWFGPSYGTDALRAAAVMVSFHVAAYGALRGHSFPEGRHHFRFCEHFADQSASPAILRKLVCI